ncbi:THAP domain-containing protein 1 A [Hydra vulgaris]|uniref:THAP domain-containing protein 1 A n=1 Tax=Hydra vulgaris TaxID=6087 RepID=UPI001F5E5CF9|nr:THAP domain-containing protein 1 A-like [Hydra vulgaris]
MVINCSVYNCKSRFDKSSLISFHRFPLNDEILCKKWATATKCLQITPSKHSRICSKHFKLEDFECQENGKRVLKKNIVPSIFDFHESLNKNNKRNQLYNDDTSHIKKTICSISNKETFKDSSYKDCALIFDSMHIRAALRYDNVTGSYEGFSSFGNNILAYDPDKLATEALIFMVVGLKGH